MTFFSPKRICCWLLGVALGVSAGNLSAQQLRIQEPRWFQIYGMRSSLGVYAEGTHTTSTLRDGSSVTYERWFAGPSLSLDSRGSFYHPNLAEWSFSGEFAPGWRQQRVSPGGSMMQRDEFEWLGNFESRVYLLGEKPYRSSLFLAKTHIFRDYDFFNSVTVDSWRYGGDFGYQTGPVPFRVSLQRRSEDTYGLSQNTSTDDTSVTFDAVNTRENGETKLVGIYNEYDRSDGGQGGMGTDFNLDLTDIETFGSRSQIDLLSTLGYAYREFSEIPSHEWRAGTRLTYEHTPRLTSFYNGDYFRTEVGSSTADNFNGGAGVRHQLYDSLTSELSAQGANYSSSGGGGSSEFRQYSLSLSENYTKRIGSSARLNIGGTVRYEQNELQNEGMFISVPNERHTFPASGGASLERISLRLPHVLSGTIVVKDVSGAVIPEMGNYTIFQNGAVIFIERTVGSVRIASGGTILVDYSAESSPSGDYQVWGRSAQIRLDLWDGRVGLYGRVNSVENDAPPELLAPEIWAWATGAEYNRNWFSVGAEYELYDSNFSSYRTARLRQSFRFRPDDQSSLTFDFSQNFTRYLDADREEQFYTAIGRYTRRLTHHLGLNVEAGGFWRVGELVDQTRYAFRPGLDFAMGRLTLKAGYDFTYNEYLNSSETVRHMLFIRARRTF